MWTNNQNSGNLLKSNANAHTFCNENFLTKFSSDIDLYIFRISQKEIISN